MGSQQSVIQQITTFGDWSKPQGIQSFASMQYQAEQQLALINQNEMLNRYSRAAAQMQQPQPIAPAMIVDFNLKDGIAEGEARWFGSCEAQAKKTLAIAPNKSELGINKEKKVSMFKSITDDVRAFMRENKQIIYWLALIMIVDHYFFENAFRDKLKSIIHSLLGKVERQVTGNDTIPTTKL